jgi:hypothetical protein
MMLRNVGIATFIGVSLAWTADGAGRADPACPFPWPAPAAVRPGSGTDANKAPLRADFRSLVDIEGELLGHLFGNGFDGFTLSLDIREAEMVVEDLRMLVRIS